MQNTVKVNYMGGSFYIHSMYRATSSYVGGGELGWMHMYRFIRMLHAVYAMYAG